MNVFKTMGVCALTAFSLLPNTADAMGISLNAGGSVERDLNLGTQIEVVPYFKPLPLLSAELGYRYSASPLVSHSIVPGINVGVPMLGRLRAGMPVGLSTDMPVSVFVGFQQDIIPLPFAKMYYEVDVESDLQFQSYGAVLRIGGKFGL